MAKLFKNRGFAERQKAVAPILDDRRLDLLQFYGLTDKTDSLDLSYNSYKLTYGSTPAAIGSTTTTEKIELTPALATAGATVDSELVAEMAKKIDESHKINKKEKKESITAKLLNKYKDTPKMSRKEMLCDYNPDNLTEKGISQTTVDSFLLKDFKHFKVAEKQEG